MKMKSKFNISMIVLLAFMAIMSHYSCNNEQEAEPKYNNTDINPNGSSELALLMRKLFDDGMEMKAQILSGTVPENKMHNLEMLTAEPTDPSETASPIFKINAESYLEIAQDFSDSDPGSSIQMFNNIVTSCMNCHNSFCPGPKIKIKKLFIPVNADG